MRAFCHLAGSGERRAIGAVEDLLGGARRAQRHQQPRQVVKGAQRAALRVPCRVEQLVLLVAVCARLLRGAVTGFSWSTVHMYDAYARTHAAVAVARDTGDMLCHSAPQKRSREGTAKSNMRHLSTTRILHTMPDKNFHKNLAKQQLCNAATRVAAPGA